MPFWIKSGPAIVAGYQVSSSRSTRKSGSNWSCYSKKSARVSANSNWMFSRSNEALRWSDSHMRKKPFWKYLIFFVILFVLFLALVAGFGFVKFTQIQGFITMAKSGAFEPPPTAVTTDVAQRTEWQPTLA